MRLLPQVDVDITTQPLALLLEKRSAARIVGVHDGISAYLAEQGGADALWSSGLCIAASKGLPDNEVITYETLVRRVDDIRRTTSLPILVDGNAGFGDHHVTSYLVRMLADRGIDGLSLEDKAFPRRNSFDTSQSVQLLQEPEAFADKLRHVTGARRGAGPMVVARTEGFIAGEPTARVLERAKLYHAAGADAIIVHSKSPDAGEVLGFMEAWDDRAPVIIIPTTYPQVHFADLRAASISGVICANQVMRASMLAIENYVRGLMSADSLAACDVPLSPLSELLDVTTAFGHAASDR